VAPAIATFLIGAVEAPSAAVRRSAPMACKAVCIRKHIYTQKPYGRN
jgi:hypothetical protein